MKPDENNLNTGPTLGATVSQALHRAHQRRPVSAYLLLAIMIVMALSTQVIHIYEEPARFAFFLSLNFAFFFVVMARAIVECGEILREYLRDREKVFKETLGEDDFVAELERRLPQGRGAD